MSSITKTRNMTPPPQMLRMRMISRPFPARGTVVGQRAGVRAEGPSSRWLRTPASRIKQIMEPDGTSQLPKGQAHGGQGIASIPEGAQGPGPAPQKAP